jgi:hypothetical protein
MLTREQLRKACPAIFADAPAKHVSENYNFIPTHRILSELEKKDWIPIHVKSQKTRNPEDMESTKHRILLRQAAIVASNPGLGGLLPTLGLTNSHNWQTNFELDYSMLRLVCGNGLCYVGANFETFILNHGSVTQDLLAVLSRFEETAKLMEQTSLRWNQIELDSTQVMELGKKAAQIRFGEDYTPEHLASLMVVRRPEDNLETLWGSHNILQENALKGGHKVKNRKVRSIGNISREKEINSQLFLAASVYDPEME